MTGNEVYNPKSVVIDVIQLSNFDGSSVIDLSDMFVEINIYEDLWQSHITGDLRIQDSLELIEFFPIVGEELLIIKWHIPKTDLNDYYNSGTLRVYKVGDRAAVGNCGGKTTEYTLYFVSEEGMTNLNQSVSRSFNTKTASEVTKIIYSDYIKSDKEIDIENTEGTLKLVIPNWRPFRAINWLCGTKAINEKKNADFFFFESLNKVKGPKFNFKSLSTLMEVPPVFTVEYKVQNLSTGDGKNTSSVAYNVDSFDFIKHGDVIDNATNGMYNQTWIYHDLLRKKFVVSKPNFSKDFYDGSGNKMFSSKLDEKAYPMQYIRMPGGVNSFPSNISSSKALNNDTTTGSERYNSRKEISYISKREAADELNNSSLVSECSYRRAFKLQQLNNYIVHFSNIPGIYVLSLGSTINFNKPHVVFDNEQYNKSSGRFDDKYLSGKYLISRLRHKISVDADYTNIQYTIAIEGIKDSFVEPVATKK